MSTEAWRQSYSLDFRQMNKSSFQKSEEYSLSTVSLGLYKVVIMRLMRNHRGAQSSFAHRRGRDGIQEGKIHKEVCTRADSCRATWKAG